MRWLGLLAMTFCLSACSNGIVQSVGDASTGCPAGVAQIRLADAFIQAICGCQENSDPAYSVPLLQGESLTCTISAGTEVRFVLLDIKSSHQIVPREDLSPGKTFLASDVFSPQPKGLVSSFVHVVRFDTAGNYNFDDHYNTSLAGVIVVQ